MTTHEKTTFYCDVVTDFDSVHAFDNGGYCVTQLSSSKYIVTLTQYIPSSKENILGLSER